MATIKIKKQIIKETFKKVDYYGKISALDFPKLQDTTSVKNN